MKKEILALFLVSLTVLVSGCTLPWESGGEVMTAGTQGLAIRDFSPDVEHPFPGQNINIEAHVQNVGVTDAKSISGKLYLITWPSTITSTCTNLKPPNADMGRDGEECILKWSLTTPSDIQNAETYDIGAHILYGYETKTTATVYAYSESEYAKMKEARQSVTKVKEIRNSNAPIHVEVRMQNVLKTGSSNVPITLIFKNVGNGNVRYDAGKHYYIIDRATAKINDQTVGSCNDIHLKGGREGSCTLKISVPAGEELKLPIDIITEYTYEASVETKITINPTLE